MTQFSPSLNENWQVEDALATNPRLSEEHLRLAYKIARNDRVYATLSGKSYMLSMMDIYNTFFPHRGVST